MRLMKIIPPKNQKYNLKTFETQAKQDKAEEAARAIYRNHYAKVQEAQAALAKLEAESEGYWHAVASAEHVANLQRHDPNLPTMIL